MGVVRSIPQNTYSPISADTPRIYNLDFNIPANTKRLRVTFSCVSWPLGLVGSVEFQQPDGTPGGSRNFIGGQIGKDGQVMPSQSMDVQIAPGVNMPTGQWNARVVVVQQITTAVIVERFT